VTFFGEAKKVTGPRRERQLSNDDVSARAATRKSFVVEG
jgi:hypothetical protein